MSEIKLFLVAGFNILIVRKYIFLLPVNPNHQIYWKCKSLCNETMYHKVCEDTQMFWGAPINGPRLRVIKKKKTSSQPLNRLNQNVPHNPYLLMWAGLCCGVILKHPSARTDKIIHGTRNKSHLIHSLDSMDFIIPLPGLVFNKDLQTRTMWHF